MIFQLADSSTRQRHDIVVNIGTYCNAMIINSRRGVSYSFDWRPALACKTDSPFSDKQERLVPHARSNVVELSADIVSAYVANNNVTPADLTSLIASVHTALSKLGGEPEAPAAAPVVPAVPIRKSVTPEAIFCLEDGKPFKAMKRHLSNAYGMTPQQYRAKWGLPADYPMVAPAYAEARSALAKSIGLGRKATVSTVKSKRAAKAKA